MILAVRSPENATAHRAMGEICRLYWFPIYAYIRRRGLSPQDAEDRTQDFFASLIEGDILHQIVPERGRLRAFLLTAVKRSLISEHRRDVSQKRGGGVPIVSIDQSRAEGWLAHEPQDGSSPDVLFDQNWAAAVLEAAIARLEAWYVQANRLELFEAIREKLSGTEERGGYREAAVRLSVSEESLRVAVFQMRKRYRTFIEREIAETVASECDAASELDHLRHVLAGRF